MVRVTGWKPVLLPKGAKWTVLGVRPEFVTCRVVAGSLRQFLSRVLVEGVLKFRKVGVTCEFIPAELAEVRRHPLSV